MRKANNQTVTILLIISLIQGPVVYYFTEGFLRLIAIMFFGITGLILTFLLFLDLIRHRSTATLYHILVLAFAFIIGVSTIKEDLMEYIDFKLRRSERNKVVDDVKNGLIKSNSVHYSGYFPVSNGGDINITENASGTVSIEFYIDRGFLDHYSAFLYTNDPDEIRTLNDGIGPFGGGVVKKLDTNWYKVSY